jgi:hypothetical protein
MRRENLTLSILVSFNELAWIAVFALVFLYSVHTTRLKQERNVAAAERDVTKRENEETARQLAQTKRDLQRLLARSVTGDTALNQQLVGLKGDLRRVVFVVDRSGSMNRGGRWEFARDVIQTWLQRLPIESCALVTFNEEVTAFPADGTFLEMIGPGGRENRASLVAQLKLLEPGGHTNTLIALQKAYEYPDVTSIILFTDGFPDPIGSERFDRDVAEQIYALCEMHGQNVPVNTIGLGDYFNRQFGEFLRRIPQETGGTFLGR